MHATLGRIVSMQSTLSRGASPHKMAGDQNKAAIKAETLEHELCLMGVDGQCIGHFCPVTHNDS